MAGQSYISDIWSGIGCIGLSSFVPIHQLDHSFGFWRMQCVHIISKMKDKLIIHKYIILRNRKVLLNGNIVFESTAEHVGTAS